MNKLPVSTAELIGTFLEAIFYGMYLVFFPQCFRVLVRKPINNWLMAYFVSTMLISFVLITIHLCVDLTRAMVAFTADMSKPLAAEVYYANVNTVLNMTKTATYTTTTLIADMVIVFRTFVIWGRNYWVIVIPLLIFAADIATSAWFAFSINEAMPGHSVLLSAVVIRSNYFYVCTFALNILCTCLIAFKIWSVRRKLSNTYMYHGRLRDVLSIVLESAAIYSVLLIILIGTSAADSSSVFFLLNSMSPVVGSIFSYMILRSSSHPDPKSIMERSPARFSTNISIITGNSTLGQNSDLSRPGGIHVQLEHVVHSDVEGQHGGVRTPHSHQGGLALKPPKEPSSNSV